MRRVGEDLADDGVVEVTVGEVGINNQMWVFIVGLVEVQIELAVGVLCDHADDRSVEALFDRIDKEQEGQG